MPTLAKILLFVFFFGLFRWLVSRLRPATRRPPAQPQRSRTTSLGKMVRDPHCGTYVAPELAISLTHSGKTLCFCSESCRDSYLALLGANKAAH